MTSFQSSGSTLAARESRAWLVRKWLLGKQASYFNRLRRRRRAHFTRFSATLPRSLTLLDVGGTQHYWERTGLLTDQMRIVLLNIFADTVTRPQFTSRVGDATNMPEFRDQEFDLVYSNSVIEHVGSYAQQRAMANEVQRVGRGYYVQTPNRYFPIEPHFLFPGFQFLPIGLRAWLVLRLGLGWQEITTQEQALEAVKEIRLLTEKELKNLFPGAKMYKEKFCGLTKSFTVYQEPAPVGRNPSPIEAKHTSRPG